MLPRLFGIMLLAPCKDGGESTHKGRYPVSGRTNNHGDRFVATRMLTTKWPLVALLAEITTLMEDRGMLFKMEWVPSKRSQRRSTPVWRRVVLKVWLSL